MAHVEITVTILQETRRFNEGAAVYSATEDGTPRNVVLQAGPEDIALGSTYTLTGYWRDRGIYGTQFQAISYVQTTPLSEKAVKYYLETQAGVGPKTAAQIYEAYGPDNTLQRIVENPARLANLPRFNATKARGLAMSIQGDLESITSKIEIQAYLEGSGFPRTLADRLYNRYGVQTVELLHRNPYLLLKYAGCGFQRVDAFAIKNGFPKNRLKRQALFLMNRIEEDGNVWFAMKGLQPVLVQQFGNEARLGRTVQLLLRTHRIEVLQGETDYWLAPRQDAESERRIATDVATRSTMPGEYVRMDTSDLTPSQAEALTTATRYRVGCFVGGPGTGKTYTVARYIRAIVEQHGTDAILVVAPTGKAVVRSKDMLQSIGVRCNACTIHSYLCTNAPDMYRWIVVDESSMIDAELMAAFLKKAGGASLLFVGDDGQLLPVGKGRPFADMLESGVIPTGRLRETMRNSGRIVAACHQIRECQPWDTSPRLDLNAGENLILRNDPDPIKAIKSIVTEWREKVDPIRDIQVICAVNKGPLGREGLNQILQQYLNGLLPSNGRYKIGDPVICLKNGVYRDTRGNEIVYLSNGEIGYCIGNDGKITVDFGLGKIVAISDAQQTFDLAYAVTGHKMQGSETPVAIVLLDSTWAARSVCTREWLYTAISRAKTACYLIGDRRTADEYCWKLGNARNTRLREEITWAHEKENGGHRPQHQR